MLCHSIPRCMGYIELIRIEITEVEDTMDIKVYLKKEDELLD